MPQLSKNEFKEAEKAGKVSFGDWEKALELIGPRESIRLLAAKSMKEGKEYVILTNYRIIFQKKGRFKLVGEHEEMVDCPYGRIVEIGTEPRATYDLLRIKTKEGREEEIATPKGSGGRISGFIRGLEIGKETAKSPAKEIKRLFKLKEEGAISEGEFKEKKKLLLKEV